MTIALVILTSS